MSITDLNLGDVAFACLQALKFKFNTDNGILGNNNYSSRL